MKQQNSTHFELWLAAYESHLDELKQGKAPVAKKPEKKQDSQTDAAPTKRP
jgi:hypothetical protein